MNRKMPYTQSLEDLLDKIEEIGTIKRKLSFRDRADTSGYGLYVQSGRLPGGAIQYMAGGRFLKKMVFVREADGTRTIKKYQPGDWELKVKYTLSLCRALERASKGQTEWTEEKFEAYWAEETFDPAIVAKVDSAWQEHHSQLNKVWHQTSPEKRDELVKVYRDELEQEWPTEFIETQLEKTAHAIRERVIKGIKTAYIVGYMIGKGWVSPEEAAGWNLWLGDLIVGNIRSTFKGTESRGTAFASAFASVGTKGTQVASGSGIQAYEPSKREIVEEILRTEGSNLIRRDFRNPELLGQPSLSAQVDYFNPTDSQYLTEAVLGARHFDTKKIESILKTLLKDNYDRYFKAAKQRIISIH